MFPEGGTSFWTWIAEVVVKGKVQFPKRIQQAEHGTPRYSQTIPQLLEGRSLWGGEKVDGLEELHDIGKRICHIL